MWDQAPCRLHRQVFPKRNRLRETQLGPRSIRFAPWHSMKKSNFRRSPALREAQGRFGRTSRKLPRKSQVQTHFEQWLSSDYSFRQIPITGVSRSVGDLTRERKWLGGALHFLTNRPWILHS